MIVVSLTTERIVQATPPPPVAFTAVAPVNPVPMRVTGTALPLPPELGVIEVSTGTGSGSAVKVTALLVPPGVAVTVTLLGFRLALIPMLKVAVTVVSFTAVTALAVTPVPEIVTVVTLLRPVPVRVTGTTEPRKPVLGEIDISVGAVTVKVTVLLVPPGVVMLTLLAVVAAFASIVKVAVAVVSFTTTRLVTVIGALLGLGVIVIAEALVRPVPVSVTATALPLMPVLGAIEVSVGTGTTNGDSMAPASTAPFVFLRFPKKSSLGAA